MDPNYTKARQRAESLVPILASMAQPTDTSSGEDTDTGDTDL